MKNCMYGYIRVSTVEQNEDRQVRAMEEFGVSPANMITDKRSGKDFDRPGYRKLLKKIKPGDLLVIKSIDRLGRNYDEILEQWRVLTKEKRADVVVLDMPLLDTRNGKDLTGTLIADIVLQLLSYVAQTEREFIKQRQREGIEAARANGVHLGRLPMKRPSNYEEIKKDWLSGKISTREAGRLLGISHTGFKNWIKRDMGSDTAELQSKPLTKSGEK